jgi:nucleoside phosphorylase
LDDVEDLLEVASAKNVRLLERSDVITCPNADCKAREMLSQLLDQERTDGEARCSVCEEVITNPAGRPVECLYQLTPDGAAEADTHQVAIAARPTLAAVVLTALPEELAAVHKQLSVEGVTPHERTVAGGGIYYEATLQGKYVDWSLYATFTEPTPASAASGAVDAILNFSPDVAIFVGIAGGIAKKGVKLGDVVAATDVLDYDSGKETKKGFVPRTRQFHSAFGLKQLAAFTKIDDGWRGRLPGTGSDLDLGVPSVHVEPIAAGSKVLASTASPTYKLIRDTADRAVAVEMEGSGFLGAVQRSGDSALVVRGISDLIDGKAAADKKGVREQAAANAVAFTFELLHRFMPEPCA